jgi:hypothetical protein
MASPFEESSVILKRAVGAGLLGGVTMAIAAVILAVSKGADPWVTLKMPSAALYLQRALEPGYDAAPVVVGILAHLGVSIVWAALFGYLVHGLSGPVAMIIGPLWGLVAGAVMIFGVLPLLSMTRLRADMPLGPTIVEHLVFGAFIALPFAVPKLAWRRHPQPA